MKDHEYKVDTKISMSLGIGLANCRHEEGYELGDFLDLSQGQLDAMSKKQIEENIEEEVSDWAHNYIDFGWRAE